MSNLERENIDTSVDVAIEEYLQAYYRYEFRAFGDPPAAESIVAQLTPARRRLPLLPDWLRSRDRTPRMRERGIRRAGILATLGAVALLTAAVAYVAAPLLKNVFAVDPGALVVHEQHLGRDVHLRQTYAGQTMTITWVYGDANRIVLRYIVQTSTGAHLRCEPESGPDGIQLTDSSGKKYQSLGAAAYFPGEQGKPTECLHSFDAQALLGTMPTTLQMHLELWPWCADQANEPVFPDQPIPPAPPTGGSSVSRMCHHTVSESDPAAYAFDLAVPFYGGTEVTPNQTVYANGMPATLERVVVSPSETRLYLHFVRGGDQNPLPFVSSLTVNGREPVMPDGTAFGYGLGWNPSAPGSADGELMYFVLAPLSELHGKWVFVLQLDQPHTTGGHSKPDVWTFNFHF